MTEPGVYSQMSNVLQLNRFQYTGESHDSYWGQVYNYDFYFTNVSDVTINSTPPGGELKQSAYFLPSQVGRVQVDVEYMATATDEVAGSQWFSPRYRFRQFVTIEQHPPVQAI